jgi:hypothetical protein
MITPILGILASSISGSKIATGSYESIATVTVGAGGSSSISFSSIPSTYSHLQIRGISRSTFSNAGGDYLALTFNSDTGANYAQHQIGGNGTSVGAAAYTSQNSGYIQRGTAALNLSNTFGAFIFDVLDYTNTNKYKTVRNLGGYEDNTNGTIYLASDLWMSTSAITSLSLAPSTGNFSQYSHFALYGIKG